MKARSCSCARTGFTMIEVLVSLGILAVIAIALVVTLNPAELTRQARDSNRINDLSQLNQALRHYSFDLPSGNLGSSSVLYVSVPDPAATSSAGSDCSNLDLPALTSGWTYHCAASSTYRNIDGTGWIPVNFSESRAGSAIATLPVDPVNTAAAAPYLYYTYAAADGKWELAAVMESRRYKSGGNRDVVSNDGGDDDVLFEMGSDLSLIPEGAGGLGEGNIDSTYRYAWAEGIGWIDFRETGNVKVNSSQLKGYATSTVGYIALDCATSPSGDVCGTSNFKITNDGSGNLSGWAWNDTTGWISFSCANEGTCGASNYGVTISATGTFAGWAWSENIGWISFSCANEGTCGTSDYGVRTTWTH
jgi:prepilin-type N-terminal cleavage/methylation domain-containing protein